MLFHVNLSFLSPTFSEHFIKCASLVIEELMTGKKNSCCIPSANINKGGNGLAAAATAPPPRLFTLGA